MMRSKHDATNLLSTALALPAKNATEAMAMLMNFIVDKNSQGGVIDLNGNEIYDSSATPADEVDVDEKTQLSRADACRVWERKKRK